MTDAAFKVSYRAHDERKPQPFLMVENVPEFMKWALYPSWRQGLHDLGYTSTEHVVQALDFGVSAERSRLFVVFTPKSVSRTPLPIVMPKRSVLGGKRRWDESIVVPKACQLGQHLRRDFGAPGWTSCADLAPGHTAKFQYNLARVPGMAKDGKVPTYWTYSYTDQTKPRLLEHPQRTITAESGGQLYVVHSAGREHHQRLARAEELRDWFGFPEHYKLPAAPSAAGRLVGNAVVPAIAEWFSRQIREKA